MGGVFLYFEYGQKEIEYLKNRDKILGEAIDKIGHIERTVEDDLFSSVVNTIIGQQISTTAHLTISKRLDDKIGTITPITICELDSSEMQKLGMTFRKVEYIKGFADKVLSGEFDLEALKNKTDAEVISELTSLRGIGPWTAEMLMTFCMKRPDIVSYGDLAILRGMRMLYHHKSIDKKRFSKYARRYSPYGTVASLYLWAIAGGAIPEMKDYAPKKEKK